jgi:hypothetical protein
MNYLWFLPLVLLAVPLFAIWHIRRSQERKLFTRMQSVIQPSLPESVPDEVVTEPTDAPARQMKWISISEFKIVLMKTKDILVVDLRDDEERIVSPVPAPSVLPVTLEDLDSVLGWLPADTTVAFYGASNLSIFKIITSPCMEGSAPLYVLEGDLRLAEVA